MPPIQPSIVPFSPTATRQIRCSSSASRISSRASSSVGQAAGADYLPGVDETAEVFQGNPHHLDQLVLVGVGSGGLLDAPGEEEVSPVVLEARGGGQGA